MVIVAQRVSHASCEVNGKIISEIDNGLVLLIGFSKTDDYSICEKLSKKLLKLRIFEDENGKMNKNIFDSKGSILAISQFTLTADIKKGNRPSFDTCMQPEKAKELYQYFIKLIENENILIKTGIFGEYMKIKILNDGPVTFILRSDNE